MALDPQRWPRRRGAAVLGLTVAGAATAVLLHRAARPAAAAAPQGPSGPAVEAAHALLMDAASGRVLLAKAAERRVHPASVTKILTAYVVLRAAAAAGGGGLDAPVTVSARATAVGGSSMYLRPGDRVSVRDLLYGMLLVSGNDAAEALAEHVAGSPAAFVDLLGRAAAEVGCTSTHFSNPSGMPAADHVTTALDLGRITRAALAIPEFSRIVATRRHVAEVGGRRLLLVNENRLLGKDGVDGVKTGYTTQAGQTYVASATRGAMRLIAVALRSSRLGKYRDAARLFAWGFSEFHEVQLPPVGRVAAQTQVRGGQAYYVDLVLPPGAPSAVAAGPGETVRVTADAPEVSAPPIRQGQPLGTLTVWIGGQPFGRWPLLAAWSVAPRPASASGRTPG